MKRHDASLGLRISWTTVYQGIREFHTDGLITEAMLPKGATLRQTFQSGKREPPRIGALRFVLDHRRSDLTGAALLRSTGSLASLTMNVPPSVPFIVPYLGPYRPG